MDAQERHDHEQEPKLTPGSKKRVEELLATSTQDAPQPSTQDPLAAAAARSGATREELEEEAAAFGF